MDNGTTPQILITNEYGWRVSKQGNGYLLIDFGRHAMRLSYIDFQVLAQLIREVNLETATCTTEAKKEQSRAIFACAHHGIVIVCFDQSVVRLTPDEFKALEELCYWTIQRMPAVNLKDTVDLLSQRIRPAISNN